MPRFCHTPLSGQDRPLEILSLRLAPARTPRPGLSRLCLRHRRAIVPICLFSRRRKAAPEASRFGGVGGMKAAPGRPGSRFSIELFDDFMEDVLLPDADD